MLDGYEGDPNYAYFAYDGGEPLTPDYRRARGCLATIDDVIDTRQAAVFLVPDAWWLQHGTPAPQVVSVNTAFAQDTD